MRFCLPAGIIFLLLLFQLPALGCSCIGEISVKDEIKRSDVVFVGKVISADTISDTIQYYKFRRIKYSFQIQTLYKGRVSSDKMEIVTGMGGGDCGFEFGVGSEYIIYANYNSYHDKSIRYLETNICRRTCLKNNSELREIEKYKRKKKEFE